MKTEIGRQKPGFLRETWPGQYNFFSYFEFLSGVPHALFLITTLKANGKPNLCFHGWSSFSGDGGGFFAIMPGLGMQTHTYRNIMRDKEFCVNFISSKYYDSCIRTINENGMDTDEMLAGGLTPEPSKTVRAPRIMEAFISLECKLVSATDLSGKGTTAMIIGEVQMAAVEQGCHKFYRICSQDGFVFNIHCPKDVCTGDGRKSAVSILKPVIIQNE
jgi:flavin reductase (DIM6/NTAB) family NADH-FMN oxidoreductase RutF